jgi:hypothetical protein
MIRTKKNLKIIRKTKRIEFWYKNEFYIYEVRSEKSIDAIFIWKDRERIYGPLINHSTEEGREVYEAIQKEIVKGNL